MKHAVWGILVLSYLALIVAFPYPMTFVSLFIGSYQVGSWANDIGKWVEIKYKEKQS